MQFIETPLTGVMLVTPTPRQDHRGRFMRAWCNQEFPSHGIAFQPVQANMGFSTKKGTIRGMHFQEPPALEAKLVRCTRGSIFDVAVDLRPGSPTYAKWYGTELTADNGYMLFVPEHCAHGYQTLEDHTEMHYMTSAYYAPNSARGVRFDDPAFAITWPLPPENISEQDLAWPLLRGSETQI